MTRRDPNAPNPYYLLARMREEEMAGRARMAARGMVSLAPLHSPSPHLVTAGDEVDAMWRECPACCACPCHTDVEDPGEHTEACAWREP